MNEIQGGLVRIAGPRGLVVRPREVWFEVEAGEARLCVGPELEALCRLPVCMAHGLTLRVGGDASPRFRGNLPQAVKKLALWENELREVRVEAGGDDAEACGELRAGGRKTVCCFDGGLDALFTLLSRCPDADALLWVPEFGGVADEALVRRVGRAFDKPVWVVRTNFRNWWEACAPWEMGRGLAWAAVGHALSSEVGRLILPSSVLDCEHREIHGIHPDLDPLWSTEGLEVEHDAAEVGRLAKLARIAAAEVAAGLLRVCRYAGEDGGNCGKCEPCFSAMAGLLALGVSPRVCGFPEKWDASAATRMDMGGESEGLVYSAIAEALAQNGGDPELLEVIRGLACVRHKHEVPPSVRQAQNRAAGEPVVAGAAECRVEDGYTWVRIPVTWGGIRTRIEVSFGLAGGRPLVGDAALVWLLPVAMFHGVPLRLADPVSRELWERIDGFQDLVSAHRAFVPMRRVEVAAEVCEGDEPSPDRPRAAAFSSGVDALFSATMEKDRLGGLVWIDGLDTEAADAGMRERMELWVVEGAEAVGLPLVTVRGNFRRALFRDLGLHWGRTYPFTKFGVAHLLGGHFSHLRISSERDYREMVRMPGAMVYSPLVMRRLASRAMRISVSGQTHLRWRRVDVLASQPWLFDKVLVCPGRMIHGSDGKRNCGRCEKCLRTLAAIRLAGAPHPAAAFDCELDLDALARLDATGLGYYPPMAEECFRRGRDPELAAALAKVAKRYFRQESADVAWDELVELPGWADFVCRHGDALADSAAGKKPMERLAEALASESGGAAREVARRAVREKVGRLRVWRWSLRAFRKGGV